MDDKRNIRLPRSTYQPSRGEMEEDIVIRNPDDTTPTPEDLARALVNPAKIRWTIKPS